jgi:hypothetical protein
VPFVTTRPVELAPPKITLILPTLGTFTLLLPFRVKAFVIVSRLSQFMPPH